MIPDLCHLLQDAVHPTHKEYKQKTHVIHLQVHKMSQHLRQDALAPNCINERLADMMQHLQCSQWHVTISKSLYY